MSDHRPPYAQAPARRHPPPAGRPVPSRPELAVPLSLARPLRRLRLHQHPAAHSQAPRKPIETGIASWYGGEFHGRRTASGERFDTHQLTAAHRTLPFGTVVEVHDLDNDRRVRVRINDRGPFAHRRIIDLSYAAAERAGHGRAGNRARRADRRGAGAGRAAAAVRATPSRSPPSPSPSAPRPSTAASLPAYPDATVRSDGTWHRVQVGEFDQRSPAERLRRELARLGYTALVVTLQ